MMPNTPEFLIHLQEKHCGYNKDCGMRISKCIVKSYLEAYNNKKATKDWIKWCPRCNGVYFFLEHDVYSEFDRKKHEVERYTGGLLQIRGTQDKTRGYEFSMACDCHSGDVRFDLQKVTRYTLTDENRNWCNLQWRQFRIEERAREAQTANPSKGPNQELQGIIGRVLGNPTADRERLIEDPDPVFEEAPAESPLKDSCDYDIF